MEIIILYIIAQVIINITTELLNPSVKDFRKWITRKKRTRKRSARLWALLSTFLLTTLYVPTVKKPPSDEIGNILYHYGALTEAMTVTFNVTLLPLSNDAPSIVIVPWPVSLVIVPFTPSKITSFIPNPQ